jgi:hypothetical protein
MEDGAGADLRAPGGFGLAAVPDAGWKAASNTASARHQRTIDDDEQPAASTGPGRAAPRAARPVRDGSSEDERSQAQGATSRRTLPADGRRAGRAVTSLATGSDSGVSNDVSGRASPWRHGGLRVGHDLLYRADVHLRAQADLQIVWSSWRGGPGCRTV